MVEFEQVHLEVMHNVDMEIGLGRGVGSVGAG